MILCVNQVRGKRRRRRSDPVGSAIVTATEALSRALGVSFRTAQSLLQEAHGDVNAAAQKYYDNAVAAATESVQAALHRSDKAAPCTSKAAHV